MQYNKNIKVTVSRCEAELEISFDVTPGARATFDDAGWGPELDGFSMGIVALRFDSGTEIDYNWLESRGLVGFAEAALDKAIDNSDVEDALGNLNEYQYEFYGE